MLVAPKLCPDLGSGQKKLDEAPGWCAPFTHQVRPQLEEATHRFRPVWINWLNCRPRGSAAGRLESWPARIATWIDLDDLALAGGYQLDTQVIASAEGITVTKASLNVDGLQLAAAGWRLEEPNVQLRLAGRWDRPGQRFHLQPATLTGSARGTQV